MSWPGNDFYGGSRSTDDGVKAAATDSMFVLTGLRGRYDEKTHCYLPPAGYRTWGDLVSRNRLRLSAMGRLLTVDTRVLRTPGSSRAAQLDAAPLPKPHWTP